ncbi:MAG TPA: methylenetetrahydrofolate reductase C-terminal domain-containing protein [Desulfatirhabdiaceae bacterium]|nr:methylenetetrahydrofolate reductase C-terminal domain-containing protein [Desulfatirhabdiaceae bacterium]
MIVGNLKPVQEIVASIRGYRRIHIVGCGSCVTVCLSGGDREAHMLAEELGRRVHHDGDPPAISIDTILRQCEQDLITTCHTIPPETDVILSLACGAGVQTMAEALSPLPVLPALNTTFLGASFEPGVWREMCAGCGDCLLGYTGGICPIARCAKSLLNGPCGGTNGRNCEVSPDIPCAWVQIIERLTRLNKLDLIMDIRLPKDWRPAGGEGPRIRQRTGIAGSIDTYR